MAKWTNIVSKEYHIEGSRPEWCISTIITCLRYTILVQNPQCKQLVYFWYVIYVVNSISYLQNYAILPAHSCLNCSVWPVSDIYNIILLCVGVSSGDLVGQWHLLRCGIPLRQCNKCCLSDVLSFCVCDVLRERGCCISHTSVFLVKTLVHVCLFLSLHFSALSLSLVFSSLLRVRTCCLSASLFLWEWWRTGITILRRGFVYWLLNIPTTC